MPASQEILPVCTSRIAYGRLEMYVGYLPTMIHEWYLLSRGKSFCEKKLKRQSNQFSSKNVEKPKNCLPMRI
jgi:hypothetical protein